MHPSKFDGWDISGENVTVKDYEERKIIFRKKIQLILSIKFEITFIMKIKH